MVVRKRLGEMLLEAGVIDEHKLQAALGHQRRWGGRLGQAFVDLKLATEAQIVAALSRKFGYQVVPARALEDGPLLAAALKLVPRDFAARHNLIPYAMDTSTISVAMADPANIAVVDEIRFRTGRRVQIALAGDRQIAAAVQRHYFGDQGPSVAAIPLDVDLGETSPGDTVVDQFGGGSTDALEDFFARPHETAASAEGTLLPFPTSAPAVAPLAPLPGSGPVELPPVDLDDLLAEPVEAPAPGRGDVFDLRLEDVEPLVGSLPTSQPASHGSFGAPPPAESQDEARALLATLDRLIRGEAVAPEAARPVQMAAALVRLLIRKGVVTEAELLAELRRR